MLGCALTTSRKSGKYVARSDDIPASDRALRAFFDSTDVMQGVIEVTDDNIVSVIVNAAVADFFDRPAAGLSGHTFSELGVPAADIRAIRERCLAIDRAREDVRFQYDVEMPVLGRRNLRVTLRAIGSGTYGRQFVCNAEDETESTTAVHQLKRSEQSFATLVKNLAGAVYRCRNDPQWTLEFVSDGCLAITGYRPDELIGNRIASLGSLIHQDDAPGVWERCKQSLAERRECSNEYRLVHGDGSVRWVWDRAQGVYDDSGVLQHIEGLLIDITERRQESDERRQLSEQLLHAQRVDSIGRLAGGVAHDFNNLLAVMLSHTELMSLDLEPAHPLQENIAEIRSAAERSAHLTRQLLGFARRQPIAPRVLDVNAALSASSNMLRRLLGGQVDVRWLPSADAWPVHIDPTQLDQILTNLCVNARDAMSGAGTLTIATSNAPLDAKFAATHPGARAGDYVELLVADNGSGMDAHTLAHIFDPFFTTKPAGKGTGLGMATVYGIVKQNGGYIDVSSALGRGTTIRVSIPRHVDPREVTAEFDVDSGAPRGDETILLVDDDPALLRMCARVLETLGYSVLAAHSPADAATLAAADSGHIHLLVTDIVMPGMDGRVLAEHLRAARPRLSVLFMSGYPDGATERGTLPAGASFLPKPFTAGQLAAIVRTTLDTPPEQATAIK